MKTNLGSALAVPAQIPAPALVQQLNLPEAAQRVISKGGMPGADGLPVSHLVRNLRDHLERLSAGLCSSRYRPWPLRQVAVEKKPGSGGAYRLLLVPSVMDRVVQTAVAKWLGARWNPNFDAASFAFRPGLGVRGAFRELANWRDQGWSWVLETDIQSFFDSIPHSMLLDKIEQALGAGSPAVSWIRAWTEQATVWDGSTIRSLSCGVPQGSPVSPLLANFYLHSFDVAMRGAGVRMFRYADDLVILARTPFELEQHRERLIASLARLQLKLHPDKTRVSSFHNRFLFLGAELRHDQILLALRLRKREKPAVIAVPCMPPSVRSAWRHQQQSQQSVPLPPFTFEPPPPLPMSPQNSKIQPPGNSPRPIYDPKLLESLATGRPPKS